MGRKHSSKEKLMRNLLRSTKRKLEKNKNKRSKKVNHG